MTASNQCRPVDFAVPADNRDMIKESVKIHKYSDLARELKTVEHSHDNDTLVCLERFTKAWTTPYPRKKN